MDDLFLAGFDGRKPTPPRTREELREEIERAEQYIARLQGNLESMPGEAE